MPNLICIIENMQTDNGSNIKWELLQLLKKEKAFWSYNPTDVNIDAISNEMLIAYTLRFLDLPEIDLLYKIFTPYQIKSAWKKFLVPEGDYLYTLNRFLAWYYFGAKKPDAYLKSLQTRHLNKLMNNEGNN